MISLLKFNTQLPLQTSRIWKRRGRHFQPLFLLSKFFFSVLTTLPYNCNNQNRNLESSWFTTIKWRVLITSIHLSCLVKLSKNNFIYEKKILRMSNINKNCKGCLKWSDFRTNFSRFQSQQPLMLSKSVSSGFQNESAFDTEVFNIVKVRVFTFFYSKICLSVVKIALWREK